MTRRKYGPDTVGRNLHPLRPRRSGRQKAMVAHLFSDDDYWWPYRSAACGREYEASRLTDQRMDIVPMCSQCAAHLPKESVA